MANVKYTKEEVLACVRVAVKQNVTVIHPREAIVKYPVINSAAI